MNKELSTERLPERHSSQGVSEEDEVLNLPGADLKHPSEEELNLPGANLKHLSEEELTQRLESVLLDRIKSSDNTALFQLGQLYFEQEEYEAATKYFERGAEKGDFQCMFQLGVINYDGLHGKHDLTKGYEYMLKIADSTSKRCRHLLRAAQYNVGLAYFQGIGVKQSDEKAEKYWLLAADDGNPRASAKAQSTLGLFYAQSDVNDLKKSFFWHSEACGNGSLESQGAMGVMYLNGLGCKRDLSSAFICLREAAERGNVYAMGNLVMYYYRRKLYTKTVELAARVSQFAGVEEIAQETDCLPSFITKGVAIASFIYARCLHMGLGVKKSEADAKQFYSKSYQFDPDVCASLQNDTQKGEI